MPGQLARGLRRTLAEILKAEDLDSAMEKIRGLGVRKVISPLFALFNHRDERVRWGAISALGAVTAELADTGMESARVVMRRLMWNLNDESGGIGWGCPEAMGEICATHEGLAREYLRILFSYAREDGNYLELDILQRGLLWGIGRVAQARPEMVMGEGPNILPYLKSEDPVVRGLAAWVA
ncbi:MAG: HEAT repeat domain-containing protein, partial [Deltaproteobacteria bacterium]|nr:HEAT repeat domain-containing protein [Deltaproteobacteria bacterium]